MKTANNQQISKLDAEKYFIVDKNNPVFVAHCDWIGYLDHYTYKDWFIPEINLVGKTFAVNFRSAVDGLHEWIQEHNHILDDYPKSKFQIDVMDGSISKDEYKDPISKRVYTISASKARKYLV